jgi:signal transduction histidine kinase
MLVLAVGILAIAALSWLFSNQFSSLEQVVSNGMFDGFTKHHSAAETALRKPELTLSAGTLMMRFLVSLGFSSCGTIAAYQLSRPLRIVLFIQLVALNLVLHGILSISGERLAMPISLLIASTAGMAFGYMIKETKETRQQLIAKDTVIEKLDRELVASSVQLVKDDETERRILAGDLHDQVLNDLKLLRERLKRLVKPQSQINSDSSAETASSGREGVEHSAKSDEQAFQDEVQTIDTLIVRSMQQIREVMDSLSPAVLQHLGFVDAIEDCIRNGAERADYKVRFRCSIEHGEFDVFKPIELTLLYRLVQETVTNICKHAEASVVKCTITADGDSVTITIADNGKGMSQINSSTQSRGLQYMRQRASIISATVKWLPGEDNKGTAVNITIRKPK